MIIQRLSFPKLGLAVLGLALWSIGCAPQTAPRPKIAELPSQSFAGKWTAPLSLKNDTVTDVFTRDEFIFVYTKAHKSYIIDREGGVLRHIHDAARADVNLYPPVVLKEYIVYPTTGALQVYDHAGKFLRSADLRDVPMGTNAVGAGTSIYYGGDTLVGGRVVCEDLAGSKYQTTSEKNELYCRGSMIAAPAFYQGMLFAADNQGDVYGVNADSFAAVWGIEQPARERGVFGAEGAIKADLTADAFGVYAASMDTKLYCLDRASGLIRWQYFAGVPLKYPASASETTVYIRVDGTGLVALEKVVNRDKHDQKPKWVARDAIAFLSEDAGNSYLRGKDNSIIAVDKATGQIKFTSRRHDFTAFGVNTKSSTIFAATADGRVYAITPVLKAGAVGEQF